MDSQKPRHLVVSWDRSPRILVVDDEPSVIDVLLKVLEPFDYDIVTANNGREALTKVQDFEPDLVLLDVMMPELDGFEVCRRIKADPATMLTPVVLVTAMNAHDSRLKGLDVGADDYLTKPFNSTILTARVRNLLRVKNLTNSLDSAWTVVFSLANALEAKDGYTEGHSERAGRRAVLIGKRLGLSQHDLDAVYIGGMLHDIGKIGIPDAILNKPGPLDPDEWEIMRQHPVIGERICQPLRSIGPVMSAIRHHHERLDGKGYPDGLKGDEIPMVARVVGVTDIYDAMVTDRPYRRGMSRDKALSILESEVHRGFWDGDVLRAMISIIESGEDELRGGPDLATGAGWDAARSNS